MSLLKSRLIDYLTQYAVHTSMSLLEWLPHSVPQS